MESPLVDKDNSRKNKSLQFDNWTVQYITSFPYNSGIGYFHLSPPSYFCIRF